MRKRCFCIDCSLNVRLHYPFATVIHVITMLYSFQFFVSNKYLSSDIFQREIIFNQVSVFYSNNLTAMNVKLAMTARLSK